MLSLFFSAMMEDVDTMEKTLNEEALKSASYTDSWEADVSVLQLSDESTSRKLGFFPTSKVTLRALHTHFPTDFDKVLVFSFI